MGVKDNDIIVFLSFVSLTSKNHKIVIEGGHCVAMPRCRRHTFGFYFLPFQFLCFFKVHDPKIVEESFLADPFLIVDILASENVHIRMNHSS